MVYGRVDEFYKHATDIVKKIYVTAGLDALASNFWGSPLFIMINAIKKFYLFVNYELFINA